MISIIIPTRNRSAYLMEAVDSIRKQTFTDWEIIIVDDGSSDNTAESVHALSENRINYVYQEPSGRSNACNHALGLARGRYLTFLDDDDLYHPRKLEIQIHYLQDHPLSDMVVSDAQAINRDRKPLYRCCISETDGHLSLQHFLLHHGILMGSFLFRRRVLAGLAPLLDPAIEPAADMDLFIRIFQAGFKVDYLPEIVFYYRLHGNNSSIIHFDRGYRRVLEKMFACRDLPAEIQAMRSQVFAYAHMLASCRAFVSGQKKIAQFNLLRAVMLDRNTVEDRMADALAKYSCCDAKETAGEFQRFVQDTLPASVCSMDLELRNPLEDGVVN